MSDPTARFAIQLQDDTSGAANAAANALEQLKARIDADTRALREMQAAMRRLQGGAVVNVDTFRQLSARIEQQKQAIANAQAQYVSLGGTFARVAPAAKAVTGRFDGLVEASKRLPGGLGETISRFSGMIVAGGGLVGVLLAAAAAFTLLAAAAVAGAVALGQYALSSADAHRSELLRMQALGGTAAAARDAQVAIDSVSTRTAMPRADVERLATSLYRAGVRGAELQTRLDRIVIRRLGGAEVAAARMRSLDVQVAKVKENLAALFSGLRIEGFLAKVQELTSLFSQQTAEGRALKAIIEVLFQPLIDAVAAALPIARAFFQGLEIGALRLGITLLQLKIWFKRTFGSEILGDVGALELALWAGVNVFNVLMPIVLGAAAAIGVFLLGVRIVMDQVRAMWRALELAGGAVERLGQWLGGLDWSSLGAALVGGLAAGIRSSTSLVVDAVRGLAERAQRGFAEALGIESPSRVFAELGLQIPAGLAEGVEAGSPLAQGAIEAMVDAPASGPVSSTRSVHVSIGEVHVHAQGADGEGLARSFVGDLARLLEGVGAELGPEPEGSPA